MARSQTKQLICGLALLVLLAAALTARAERLPIKVYTTADGLAHNRIGGILRDSRGLLWLSTAGGLSRFDGARFTTYNIKDGLPSLTINWLLETRAGKFWVATNNDGVAYLDGNAPSNAASDAPARGSFTAYAISDDPTTNRVNALFEDHAGGLWAETDGGLFCSDKADGNFHRVALEISEHADRQSQVWAFAEDDAGSLWIATKFGPVARAATVAWFITTSNRHRAAIRCWRCSKTAMATCGRRTKAASFFRDGVYVA